MESALVLLATPNAAKKLREENTELEERNETHWRQGMNHGWRKEPVNNPSKIELNWTPTFLYEIGILLINEWRNGRSPHRNKNAF